MNRRVEWAVIQIDKGVTTVHQDGLGSREEADAWLAALKLTLARAAHDRLLTTGGIDPPFRGRVAWRYIDPWHPTDEEPDVEP